MRCLPAQRTEVSGDGRSDDGLIEPSLKTFRYGMRETIIKTRVPGTTGASQYGKFADRRNEACRLGQACETIPISRSLVQKKSVAGGRVKAMPRLSFSGRGNFANRRAGAPP